MNKTRKYHSFEISYYFKAIRPEVRSTLAVLCLFLSFFISPKILANDSNIKTVSFYSNAVEMSLKYTIILPESYEQSKTNFPVMYLLHGHTGNYKSWLSYAQLPAQLTSQYNCIIVLPDAGNSWYVNWTGQTDGKPHRWEDMLMLDLIPHVDKHFRTNKNTKGRFIGGLSMGGFGALSVGLRNHQQFGVVFSIAGAINFCQRIRAEFSKDTIDWNCPSLWSDDKKLVDIPGFSNDKERTPKGLVFKKPDDSEAFDPYPLLSKIDSSDLPFIITHCGTKDDFLPDAYQFISQLSKKTSNYCFLISPGEHETPYWKNAIEEVFMVIQQNKPLLTK